ncbi:ABC transporter ATP-binding protein [Patescibacteria group bacterium]
MSQFTKIVSLAKPYWKTLGIIIVFILFQAGLNQAEPFINRSIVDKVANALSQKAFFVPEEIIKLFAALLLVRFSRTIVKRVVNYFTNLFVYKLRFVLREKGFNHLMKLSVSYFDKTISGELMSKLDRGTAQITQIINNSGLFFIPSLITAIVGIVIVGLFYWPLAVWILLMFIPFTLISLWRFSKNRKLEKQEYKLYDTQYGHFWEAITSMRLIKSFIAEEFELRRLKGFHQKILNIRKTIERNWNIGSLADLFLEGWVWSVYVWVVIESFRGRFSLGTMVLLINYIDIIRWPLWELNWFFWEAKRAQIGARDYFKILQVKPDLKDSKKPKNILQVKGDIKFNQVSFSYKQEEVIKNISINIKSGSTVAFVGPSGSGKTTIVSLISRFYDVSSGKITLDGIDIKKLRQRDLRNSIGWVTQEAYLFADTIEENLRYGKADATLKEIEQACKMAHAHEFIKKLPHKYQTKIGERGIQLSGGQKQRVALARVILKNPPILILDEATSALDSVSEMLIAKALEKITKGRTTIIIAHRLSTAKNADNIFVMDGGELIEHGKHDDLIENDGLYASLFKIQAGKTKKLKNWNLRD